ncbi:MAG: lipoprotein-releasing ABC transporter ATP-binding protein LolD [Pseudomonadales bacterium]|nr:lipoprotein-releasing ABC transporter ATP-binding protein LolD [Pseudomonadales bacterium]
MSTYTTSSSAVIECTAISKVYKQGEESVSVLNDVSFTINRGDCVAIVGASGAGKSTLLNLLGGLDNCSSGQVKLLGHDLAVMNQAQLAKLRNEELGFVYQFHHLLSEFDALENTAMPLLIRGLKRKQAFIEATDMLEKVGLKNRLHHRPSELSGGERQRVAIARALVAKPSCVLMDEPTGNLDEQTADKIQNLLVELNQQLAISFVLVTHDMHIARQQNRILQLHDGHLTELDPAMEINAHV